MLANAKKSDEDEMLNNEMETSENGSGEVDVNGETDCKSLKLDITSSLNDDAFDVKDDTCNVPKLNGDSDANDWLSSSSSDSESEHNSTDHETPTHQQQYLSNESSHCDPAESSVDTNGSLNGSTTRVSENEAPFTKKVRPLKICFGVKNSVNGLKVKNSKISNDGGSKVHYIERPSRGSDDSDEDNLSEPEPEPEPEYAQYLGLKPSVKFKCSRCGVKNFASMALLNEHMASCDGQTPLTVSTAVPSSSVMNGGEDTSTNLRITRKVFLCSSCGTYYQSYDLYIHMRELHAKQICLVCFNMFGKSQQLWDHLISAHNLKLGEYTNVLQIRNAYKGSFYITCCTCNRLFSEDEPFDQHRCESNFVVAPEPPSSVPVTLPVPENARYSSVTRDDITYSKLPYLSQSPLAASPMRVDRSLSPDFFSSAPAPPSPPSSPISPSLPPTALPADEPKERKESEHDTLPTSNQVTNETSPPHEPPRSPSNIIESPPPQSKDTFLLPESSAGEPEPELEQTDDTIAPVECEKTFPSEYTEPPAPEVAKEVPKADEPGDDIFVPNQPSAPVIDGSSDDDSMNAASPNHHVEPEEPPADADVAQPAAPVEEEKVAQPLPMALMLDETIASLDAQTLIKECVRTSCTSCAYCHNSTLVTVNGYQLGTHLLTEHRYKPTKNEDDSEQVEQKIRSSLQDLQDVFFSASSSNEFDGTFSCFQCSYSTTLLKELCAHNRKSHQMTIFLCCICKCSFIYYSELLCHECPGEYSYDVHSLKYRCCYCPQNHLPSAFRLMVHLRKHHKSCNFCLLKYNDQYELFAHMTKQHKMPHLCYKCNIAYRSRNDINKHLFWKHGTESVLCQRCLQKKWPHAYHFCMPGTTYTCDECNRVFSKAVALTVHRRAHNGEFPFTCENCDQRFISKRLLAAHRRFAHPEECKPEELQILDTSATPLDAAQASKPGENSDDGGADPGTAADRRSDDATDGRKRRKKKRKKEKPNEKPLLDELPPLNLSSESDDESGADEDPPPKPAPEIPSSSPKPSAASSPLPFAEPATDEGTQPASSAPEEPLSVAKPLSTDIALEEKPEPTISVEGEIPAVEKPADEPVEESIPIPSKSPSPTKEQVDKELLERALNCVLIEHSYCIPESIFHSAGVDLNGSVDDETATSANHHRHEGSVSPARSQHRHDDSTKTTEDSCCKSASSTTNTPRKRKHARNNKTSSGESSSSSSSDSDSSSSSCGSNCSCNRSNSGCSSSSSAASDCSTTPEKKKPKKSKRERDEEEEKRTQQQREQMFLLDARESDLDTELSSAGEDFYEERPCYVPPQPSLISASASPQQQQQQIDTKIESPSDMNELQRQRALYEYNNQQAAPAKTSTKNRKDKKKKKKRIKLSLAGRIPPNCAPLRALQQQRLDPSPRPVPNNEFTNPELLRQAQRPPQMQQQYHQYNPYADDQPQRPHLYPGGYNSMNMSMANNCVSNSDGGAGPADDSNSRLSKRKRVKNKFYGYSSSDEAGRDSPATKSVSKKRVLTKKPSQPKNRQFIGIRAKLPPSNKRLSVSIPFTPVQYPVPDTPPVPTTNVYRPPPAHASAPSPISSDTYNPYRNRYSSSEDSDSDEKRHTLVINLPNPLKDRSRTNNSSYKPSPPTATYSDESMSSNSYVSSPRQQPEIPMQNAAAIAAMRSQQLFRARMGTSGGIGGIGATNSPLKNSEKLYCYCQCPYDEVSEMIGCDAPNCKIEWFHFECVGIMVPPKGEWFCPSCRRNRENVSSFV